jgi:hypothetical protein
MMKKLALLLAFLCTQAHATALPVALTFIGYGQSTMQGPVSGDSIQLTGCSISGSVLTISGYGGSSIIVGSPVSGAFSASPTLTITSFGTGTGGNGTYNLSSSAGNGYSGSCTLISNSADWTLVTGSNINANAFMIGFSTGAQPSPRGWYDSGNWISNKPVNTSNWSGFTQLHEYFAVGTAGAGGYNTESPVSSFVSQYLAATGLSAPNAVIVENMAVGGEDWLATGPSAHLAPGGPLEWVNLVSAQKFIKNNVQGSTTALSGTGFPSSAGPWTYRLGGIALRLGEAAAATGVNITVNGTTIASGSTSSITVSTANPYVNASTPVGWCVYDHTSSSFLGYLSSWGTTNLTLTTAAATSGSGTTDTLWLSPCYPGYLAELKSMLAQFTASDVSDAPNPGGVPIFAHIPSSTHWGNATVTEGTFAHLVNAAYATAGLADRRMVVSGPSFECGPYQGDAVHGLPRENAMCGAYMGKWAGWYYSGYRTAPFTMISAQWLAPGSSCSATYYCIRVTFQMPPSPAQNGASVATQQTLQLYNDGNSGNISLPAVTNSGFCYMDGAYPAGGSSFFTLCGTSSSGASISSAKLATADGGAANQIDLVMSVMSLTSINSAGNPTVSIGLAGTPNGTNVWGMANPNIYVHNVANQDCTKVANAGLAGEGFPNTNCNGGSGGSNYLIDFAAPSFIVVGQTLTTAW